MSERIFYDPESLHGLVLCLCRNLPISEQNAFIHTLDIRYKRIAQASYCSAPHYDTNTGTDALEALIRWYTIGLLLHPKIGVFPFVRCETTKARIRAVAGLLFRWIDDDPPSEGEWEQIGKDDSESIDDAAMIPDGAVSVHQNSPMASELLAMDVAMFWDGRKVPTEFLGRFGDRSPWYILPIELPLFWCIGKMRAKSDPPYAGNPAHYRAQAHWLLHLMRLPWASDDESEAQSLWSIQQGDAAKSASLISRITEGHPDDKIEKEAASTLDALVQMRKMAPSV